MPFLASKASQTAISCFFMKAVFLRDACSCNKASSQTDRGIHHPPDTGGQGDRKHRHRAPLATASQPVHAWGQSPVTGDHKGRPYNTRVGAMLLTFEI